MICPADGWFALYLFPDEPMLQRVILWRERGDVVEALIDEGGGELRPAEGVHSFWYERDITEDARREWAEMAFKKAEKERAKGD